MFENLYGYGTCIYLSKTKQLPIMECKPRNTKINEHEGKISTKKKFWKSLIRTFSLHYLIIIQISKVYKDKTQHKITEFYTEWFGDCSNITSKFSTIDTFKYFDKQTDGFIKLLGMYKVFSWAKLHLSVINSWGVSIKKLWNLTFNRPSRWYFGFHKIMVFS
jgi:hypothetical protein